MDDILPYRVLSPGAVKLKIRKKKQSKLCLKDRCSGTLNGKENMPPRKITGKRNEAEENCMALITDDESESETSFSTRGGTLRELSTVSNVMRESALSLPVAESTRCDLYPSDEMVMGSEESKRQQFFSASSSSSSNSKFVTAELFPVGCNDESIICISDSDEDSPTPVRKNAAKPISIIISSDDSDNDADSGRRSSDSLDSLRKSLVTVNLQTVIPPSSESDDGNIMKRALNVSNSSPRKRCKTPSALLSSLISDDQTKGSLQSTMNIDSVQNSSINQRDPSHASARDSICSIVSSSVIDEPHLSKTYGYKYCEPFMKGPSSGPFKETARSSMQESVQSFESSWKKSFRLVMPETSVSVEEASDKKSTPDSRSLFPPNSVDAVTLSRRKFDDIERWLIRDHLSDNIDSDSDFIPPSPPPEPKGERFTGISSKIQKEMLPSKTSEPKFSRRLQLPGLDETADEFQAMIGSLRKEGAQSDRKLSSGSSFINDNSSSGDSCSPSLYHRVITNTIKKDVGVKDEKRQVRIQDECRKKLLYFSQSDSDDSDLPSDLESKGSWKPGQGKKKVNDRNKKTPSVNVKSFSSDDKSEDSVDKCRKPIKSLAKNNLIISDSSSSPSDSSLEGSMDDPRKVQPKPTSGKPKKRDTFKTPQLKPKRIAHLKTQEASNSPIRTFLSSLSGPPEQKGIRSHPEGERYFKHFKSKKEELARRLYKLYNREVFDSRLPEDMLLEWNARMVRTAGFCYCKLTRKGNITARSARIVLSTKVLTSADRLRDTLIHEMCHAAVWLLNNISGGHGPFWKAWASKAMKRFPELPSIRTCHEYSIETKYTYKCTSCGYSFGRHSKSLDLQRQRCGHCYGTFEVFVNKLNCKGQEQTPASKAKTPRVPNAFALFVKENYSAVKKGNSSMKHGDIMKTLSHKFAEIKLKAS